jgi:hypothetical protein
MKRLIIIGLAMLTVLIMSIPAYSGDTIGESKSITVTMIIEPVFGMYIWDQFTQTIYPATGSETFNKNKTNPMLGDINMYVFTNRNVPWTIQASSAGCTNDTSVVVPIKIWAGRFGAGGDSTFEGVLTEGAETLYQSSDYELNVWEYEVNAGFGAVGFDKGNTTYPQGTYTGTLTVTLVGSGL